MDSGQDGELTYTVDFLSKDDTFKVISRLVPETKLLNIVIPGRYLDAKSPEPIIFTVTCEDYGEPKLKSDIIIFVRPQSVNFKPIYFEFDHDEFHLIEMTRQSEFKLKLINDNLNKSNMSTTATMGCFDSAMRTSATHMA